MLMSKKGRFVNRKNIMANPEKSKKVKCNSKKVIIYGQK
jgi:hypothetical protein